MTVTLVTMVHPCSACLINDNLMRELFAALEGSNPDVSFTVTVLNHPRELPSVEGLEVESLPAVLIDGEQITAGSLLHRRQLEGIIKRRLEGAH